MTIRIDQAVLESLTQHPALESPSECCGIPIGRWRDADAFVERAVPANGVADGHRATNCQIDWNVPFENAKLTRQGPLEIVGFHHSYPDGSAEPSHRARESAWVDHAYVIMSAAGGSHPAMTSWRIPSEGIFDREPMVLHDPSDPMYASAHSTCC